MTAYQNNIKLQLVAAVANGIALSQSGTAATPLTLGGSLVSGGAARFDVARRVIVTSAGNDSANSFTIVGTGSNGRPQTEVLTGGNGAAAQTARDFLTVTSITPTSNTASTVTAGTNGVGSSVPIVLDAFATPAAYGAAVIVNGTLNYTVETAMDDFSPQWDLNANVPTWFAEASFNAQSTNIKGIINGPVTLMRLTINSGTGSAALKVIQPLSAGRSV